MATGLIDHFAGTNGLSMRDLVIARGDSRGQFRPPWPASSAANPADARAAQLERDLHDGVQNELVALIVGLSVVKEDPDTPPALAQRLARLEARAQAALDSVRDIARGIYPPMLSGFGITKALRAQALRTPIDVRLVGDAPRSIEEAEAAVYFSCLEAMQNVAKHAGPAARAIVQFRHCHGTLTVRIEDDGRGFDSGQTRSGAGLKNIGDRIQARGGRVELDSKPGRGTVVTISLPWPPRERTADARGIARDGSNRIGSCRR